MAFFSIAQTLRWHNDALHANWRLAFTSASRFGPFVNRNHEGGYLNLCLAGAIGLVALALQRGADRREEYQPQAWDRHRHPAAILLRPFANLSATLLFAIGLAGCMVAAILCSLSRSASLSIAAGLVLLLLADFRLRQGRRMRLWPLALAAVAGIGLVSWIGARDVVLRRWGSLFEPGALQEGRLYHWRDALHAAADFWPVGSGLGTYQWIYQAYQHRSDVYWYQHAENQYLETLVVAGVPGLLLLLGALGVTVRAACRALAASRRGAALAFAVAALFALVTRPYNRCSILACACRPMHYCWRCFAVRSRHRPPRCRPVRRTPRGAAATAAGTLPRPKAPAERGGCQDGCARPGVEFCC